jgi:NTP pyrophosphatase (non-canonical NTP hydrolase)
MKKATLAQLAALVLRYRKNRDWEQFHTPKDMAIGLALEAAELLELVHWKNGAALKRHLRARREHLADELADILGWLLLMAHDFGIDLAKAFRAKMKKNQAKYPIHKARGTSAKYTEL